MNATYQPGHAGDSGFYIRPQPSQEEVDLSSLQVDVLDALEEAGHPEHRTAKSDPAIRALATSSQRKAWLAIYGPMTNLDPTTL